jgi:Mn-dependent DtxR family transcriptional regulator
MTLLSMSIVAGLQSVGVILIIAMLITPPATAFLLTDKLKNLLLLSCTFGIISSVIGLYLSYHLNFASGASIVLVAAAMFGLTFLFSPKEGIVHKYLRRKENSKLNLVEDIIKLMHRNEEMKVEENVIHNITSKLGIPENKIHSTLGKIARMGLINLENGKYILTTKGNRLALRLVRSHRLWETYVTEKNIVTPENIHQDAEKYEHILSEDLLAEIDEELGHPEKDPHGSPIPKKQ